MGRSARWTETEEIALCKAAIKLSGSEAVISKPETSSYAVRLRDAFLKHKPKREALVGWKEADILQELSTIVHWESRTPTACHKAWLKISAATLKFHEKLLTVEMHGSDFLYQSTSEEKIKIATHLYNRGGNLSEAQAAYLVDDVSGPSYPHLAAYRYLRSQNVLSGRPATEIDQQELGFPTPSPGQHGDGDVLRGVLGVMEAPEFMSPNPKGEKGSTSTRTTSRKRKASEAEVGAGKAVSPVVGPVVDDYNKQLISELEELCRYKMESDAKVMAMKREIYHWRVMSHPLLDPNIRRKYVRKQQQSVLHELDVKVKTDNELIDDHRSTMYMAESNEAPASKQAAVPEKGGGSLSADCTGNLAFGKCGCTCRGSRGGCAA
mmetsp:Transcript_17710/g.25527  ORF Transcript_17710/g.25527 Transcript_17710/m.25527 type:complete len:379 (-) Transcript_17710:422-1558(-)